MLSIPEVVNTTSVRTAEFVRIDTPTKTFTFSTAAKDETINTTLYPNVGSLSTSTNYEALGALISIGQQQRDLRATSFDTSIALSGVDPENLKLALDYDVKGSKIWIGRGFYNEQQQLSMVYLRFSGIVTSYNISEDTGNEAMTFSILINCSSFKTVLENNRGGRRTNRETWDTLYAGNDTSMYNVENLSNAQFDFGKPVTGSTAAVTPVNETSGGSNGGGTVDNSYQVF
jgi:hypothetical protein